MEVAVRSDNAVARPLNVLVPLIKQDFEAAEKAGMAYYKAAGEKLNEASEDEKFATRKDFFGWAEKTFSKKPTQIRTYMALAEARIDKSFKNFNDFRREGLGHNKPTSGFIRREWTAPVDAVADKTRREQLRLQREDELSKKEERNAINQLKLRVIEIGYKVLAKELHPDKGGTREAFGRLKQAVDEMKRSI